MTEIIYLLIMLLSILVFNKIFISSNILLSQSGEKHQRFVEKDNVPLLGGIYFLILFLSIFLNLEKYILSLSLLSIFTLGIFSDLKIIKSPKKRFFLQALLILIFIYFLDLEIVSTRIPFFDMLFEFKFINFIFVLFCVLILVNGTNFIDGLNGLVIGYFGIVSLALLKINFFEQINFSQENIIFFFGTFTLVFIFNFFKKLYLGDNGAYVISLLFGLSLINYHQSFPNISPYFIILLLWYPCFENLFSIIRKFRFNKSPIHPDENHFHQVLFFFIRKKFNLKNLYANNFSSFIILSINTIFITFGLNDIYSTKLQIFLIILSSMIYIFSYFFLFNFKYKNFNKKLSTKK
tara:strand:+ start:22056 stop:23105 length:1050 start_codon:yes stop_codon:yes gene_type:complete